MATEQPDEGRSESLSVRVSFLGLGYARTRRGAEPYATYSVDSAECSARWHSSVRWSDMVRLHDELAHFGISSSTFRRHTLRMGSARFSPSFVSQRAAKMEAVLNGLIASTRCSLLDATGPPALRTLLTKGCDVDDPTPPHAWYSSSSGWPASALSGVPTRLAARCLTPPIDEAPELYARAGEAIGELRVEILEATGLVKSDAFSQNDVYAVVALEGHAAQTAVLEDSERREPDHTARPHSGAFLVS